jgi:peptide/nickel transport system substrate-binding protein
MRNFILFIKNFHFYKKKELQTALTSFSKKQIIVFLILLFVAGYACLSMLSEINNKLSINVPTSGGTINEGVIGMPTLINPVLAISDADKDLTSVVYSGLMKKMPDGTLINDLAENYSISPDNLTYNFTLKSNAVFHNGDKITADDIIFTIEKIKNPVIKSPKKSKWEGVSLSKIDELNVSFTLSQPFISFMDNMTVGILPQKLWKNVNDLEFGISPLNIKAVGSGPFQIEKVAKNKDGIPVKYTLERFNKYILGKSYLKRLNIISYANEKDLIKALISGNINQASGISPNNIDQLSDAKFKINTALLPRIFSLFVNTNKNKIFTDSSVIRAIDLALDRQDIINQVLGGYGVAIHNPISEIILKKIDTSNEVNFSTDEAIALLEKNGWILGEDGIRYKTETKKTSKEKEEAPAQRLSFSITTGDTPELRMVTSIIKEQLSKIGIEINIDKVYETGQLNQVIKDRDYEALFFGQIVNHESDLYSFWHSSQRTHPGLNIAMFGNVKIDNLLETIQKTGDPEIRKEKYEQLIKEFDENIPAIFIYSPKYLYITSNNLYGVNLERIVSPSDRFSNINNWYTEEDKVWKIFSKYSVNNN